ncbi:MAG: dCTP deaminase [Firmicutes bacterium]|nr:dCTP deaminase [Bacillota bacterium]
MILNESQILERLLSPDPARRLVVTPLLAPEQQFGPSSLDVRLGPDFKLVRTSRLTHLDPLKDPAEIEADVARYTENVVIQPGEPFVLHPGEFALASTLEFIRLPFDIAARLEGRSTWGRLGLEVHATAGFVDPGFSGALTFELKNSGKVPLPLYAGLRVAQLCFFQLSEASQLPYAAKRYTKYSGRMGTEGSQYFRDPEYAALRAVARMRLAGEDAARRSPGADGEAAP